MTHEDDVTIIPKVYQKMSPRELRKEKARMDRRLKARIRKSEGKTTKAPCSITFAI